MNIREHEGKLTLLFPERKLKKCWNRVHPTTGYFHFFLNVSWPQEYEKVGLAFPPVCNLCCFLLKLPDRLLFNLICMLGIACRWYNANENVFIIVGVVGFRFFLFWIYGFLEKWVCIKMENVVLDSEAAINNPLFSLIFWCWWHFVSDTLLCTGYTEW